MLETATQKSKILFLIATLLGGLAGWYIGRLFGLNADQWFAEPESNFELLTSTSGFACGALFAFVRNKPIPFKLLGTIITSGFCLTIIAYGHYSYDVPPHKIGTILYLPELLIHTFGAWFPALLGAMSVMLLRIISR